MSDPNKFPTEAFIESMGDEWWENLSYSDKVEYHGKIIADNWNADWKTLIGTATENTDLSRTEAMLTSEEARLTIIAAVSVFC
jgi:hypothetical protein